MEDFQRHQRYSYPDNLEGDRGERGRGRGGVGAQGHPPPPHQLARSRGELEV